MDQKTLIIAGLIVASVAAVIFLVFFDPEKSKTKKRVAGMGASTRRASRGTGQTAAQAEAQTNERRKKLAESLDRIDSEKNENKKKQRVTLQQMIEQSGMNITIQQFYIGSIIAAVVLGVVGLISGQKLWVTGLMFFVGGVGLPRWFVNMARKRRQKKFINEFSNSIDVIVRGVKSGLPVNECLKIISREAPMPVSEEFHMLTESIRVGLSLDQALMRMYERMPVQEVNFFAIVLMIQAKTGGNLAEALGNLSTVLRSRKMMEGKVKALSAEAKASAMIIGVLPFLVGGAVHLTAPDYLAPLFTTRDGNMILLGAGFWMFMGITVMKKMIAIKV